MRNRLALVGSAAVLLALAVAVTTSERSPAAAQTPTPDGAELFQAACSSCHGIDGSGADGPSLVGVGAASADFQLTTGRMPLPVDGIQPVRKPPAFSPAEIAALVEFVASLGPGPAIPDVDAQRGDLAQGGVLYRANCAACHGATGTGTSLSYGQYAPNLYAATGTQIGEAMRTGPGNMPVFSVSQLSDHDVDSIAAYVAELQRGDNPGGLGLGRVGPIPEGLVAWFVGVGGLILGAMWVERRVR